MAYSPKLNLIYIHIPKCAGTSIIEALKTLDPAIRHGHDKWREYEKKGLTKSISTSFTVVRNPWSRIFSSYNYVIQKENYWHGADKKEGIHPDYGLLNNKSFRETLEILYKNRDLLNLPEHQRPNFGHNWSYQYHFICDHTGSINIQNVFRFESLENLKSYLKTTYDLGVPKLNSSTAGLDYQSHYDDSMKQIVFDIYKKDIELFGYDF